jgi:hypothetical protein
MPPDGPGIDRAALRAQGVTDGQRVVITANLPEKLQAGGVARQPLLWVADNGNQGPAVPRVTANANASFTVFAAYVEAGAKVLVNGTLCSACTATFNAGAGTAQIGLAPAPSPAGTWVIQLMNPEGFASNELPVVTQ